jgi:Zn-dependent protease
MQRDRICTLFGVELQRTSGAVRLVVALWSAALVYCWSTGTLHVPLLERLSASGDSQSVTVTIVAMLALAVVPPLVASTGRRALIVVSVTAALSTLGQVTGVGAVLAAAAVSGATLIALLVHEYAHAIVGARHGIDNNGIVVTAFGAATSFPQDEFPSPRAMFATTAAGPFASLLFAGAAAAPALFTTVPGWWWPVVAVNALVAAVNAIPSLPLDGGWCVTAAVWRWRLRTDPAFGHHDAVRLVRRLWALPLVVGGMIGSAALGAAGSPLAVPVMLTCVVMFPILAMTQRQLRSIETGTASTAEA